MRGNKKKSTKIVGFIHKVRLKLGFDALLQQNSIKRIGVYDTFIHADNSTTHEQDVIW